MQVKFKFLLLLLTISNLSISQSIEENIFKITVGCGIGCKQQLQTGFRLKNYKGIITTLHGLSGATTITAENQNGLPFKKLWISQVDFSRDIAILTNDDLEKLPLTQGLSQINNENISTTSFYSSYAHPFGVKLVPRNDIKLSNPALVTLIDRIPKEEQQIYKDRRSPLLSIRVIEMRYNFGNGESGAPILNQQNQVIGINDGGFASINISWAIPIFDIQLNRNVDLNAISQLKATPVKLHSYQIDIESISKMSIDDLSERFQSWYFSLMKINPNNEKTKATDLFDKSTISDRFFNSLDLDNGEKYTWLYDAFFGQYPVLHTGDHPLYFIVVNVDNSIQNRHIYTVYFRYSRPLYGIKYKEDEGPFGSFPDIYYFTLADYDDLKNQQNIKEYKLANIQATFILDNQHKLVDIKEIKTVLQGEKYFQNK